MGKIISTTECKAILQISGSNYDTFINVMIPITEDYILKYTNLTEDSASKLPGLKLAAAQFVNYQLSNPSNISSETIGNYSVTYQPSYPEYLVQTLKTYRQVKFIQDTTSGGNWQANLLETINEGSGDTDEYYITSL